MSIKLATPDARQFPGENRSSRVEAVIGALGRRRFLRRPLVASRTLELAVASAVEDADPIPVLVLWGKGRKPEPDRAERRVTDFLGAYSQWVSRTWSPGVHYVVLFADTHASINGHDALSTFRYFQAVERILEPLGPDFGTLSAVCRKAGIGADDVSRKAAGLDALDLSAIAPGANLAVAARRHTVSGDPAWAARRYCAARLLEGPALCSAFPGHLFATSDPVERASLQPQLPVLPLRSWGRRCEKPWNVLLPELDSPDQRV